eukprot:evm.model.scf_925.4 EVM.evm.TU.scf_925.4   scf_925:35742-39771(+)
MPSAAPIPPVAGRRYQGVDKASTAFRMLETMGWREGEGLGAEGQGIREHVKATKKLDNSGVGKAEAKARSAEVSVAMVNYDRILSNLTEVQSPISRKRSVKSTGTCPSLEENVNDHYNRDASKQEVRVKKSKKAKGSGDGKKDGKAKKGRGAEAEVSQEGDKCSEYVDGTVKEKGKGAKDGCGKGHEGGAGKSKGKKKQVEKGKKKKTKVGESVAQATDVSDCKVDKGLDNAGLKVAGSDQVEKRRKINHMGRFKKQERAKMVKNYSSVDMAAIFGGAVSEGARKSRSEDGGTEVAKTTKIATDENLADEGGQQAESAQRQPEHVEEGSLLQQHGIGIACDKTAVGDDPKPQWWQKRFVKSGCVTDARNRLPVADASCSDRAIKVSGFSEDDQTALWERVHGRATSGKKGLVETGSLRKVSGVKVGAGVKKTFVDSDDDDEDEVGAARESEVVEKLARGENLAEQLECQKGVVIIMPQTAATSAACPDASVPRVLADDSPTAAGLDGNSNQQGRMGTAGAHGSKGKGTGQVSDTSGGSNVNETAKGKPKPKWKSLAVRVFRQTGKGKMKVGKFQKRVLRAGGLRWGDGDHAAVLEKVMRAVEKSSRLSLKEGYVFCKTG